MTKKYEMLKVKDPSDKNHIKFIIKKKILS
mgnify:CR=1 FL=1